MKHKGCLICDRHITKMTPEQVQTMIEHQGHLLSTLVMRRAVDAAKDIGADDMPGLITDIWREAGRKLS